jgi:hypothetical protein
MGNANTQTIQFHDCQRENKINKLFIVSSTNTGAKPSTMMIKFMYTNATEIAMKSTFRSVNQTC